MTSLTVGWELAATPAGELARPPEDQALDWRPAQVPGTVALALQATGALADAGDLDDRDWWFRTRFETHPVREDEQVLLALEGVATVADVFLNGEPILHSDSMFAEHECDVGGRLSATNELAICCRALAPVLARRRRPRARWRTLLVAQPNLRFVRTMLLGRAPGFAPGPPVVGPYKPVRLERRRRFALHRVRVRARRNGEDASVSLRAQLRALGSGALPAQARVELSSGGSRASGPLMIRQAAEDAWELQGEVHVRRARTWWPHTHGDPALYEVTLSVAEEASEPSVFALGRVGFRTLEFSGDFEREGLQLRINGVSVFARGAVWTPGDLGQPCQSAAELRPVLEAAAGAGMNMLRIPGTACYESRAFYDLCDELGILVWQDFMFANLDYPEQDEEFMEAVRGEARALLNALGSRPSLSVLCGGSEVAQQVAMLGLDVALAHGPLFGELLPDLVTEAGVEAFYVPSAPWGGELPFRPDRGIANYYGVGGYRRPLEDARRAEVKFAAECLAFANVPDELTIDEIAGEEPLSVVDPRWKAGVPRDRGAGWDFDDIRDHYLRLLFELDPVELRAIDLERYLELSRVVSAEVMSEVFGEWRRGGSPCAGALVLWLRDLVPGAGWGVLDHAGRPKVALHHLRRVLAPVAVWSTNEGLGGIAIHIANDRPQPLRATLRVGLYRDLELRVGEASRDVELEGHSGWSGNVEALVGRFVDAAWAYRFGPPAQDLVVLSLEQEGGEGTELLSQSFRLPAGRPVDRESPARLGLSARWQPDKGGGARIVLSTRRFAYGVRVHVPGYAPADDAFSLEPGRERALALKRRDNDAPQPPTGRLTALNLAGHVGIDRREDA